MLDEIVEFFSPVPAGVLIDATLGGAGHSAALLAAHPQLRVLGLDRDADAVKAATKTLEPFGDRYAIANVRFDAMTDAVASAFPEVPVVGVLFDLGVSSPQLDWAERGFSYRFEGPLDMRMDRRQALSAAEVVNEYDLDRLTDVLRDGGEEQFARRIARAVVEARPVKGTMQLADARRRSGDPAKRTFQAIRIEVNQELEVLGDALDQALTLLSPGGRLVTLAYHSGEDRLIKQKFLEASTGGCACPPGLPCVCGAVGTVRLLKRGSQKPTEAEALSNKRAKSARLRAVEALQTGENGEIHS
jgi:16S rRNA (cytosine1402-N4)-methyltransferase